MDLENCLIIVCSILFVVCYIGYRHSCKHVYLKYKVQKVGSKNVKEERKQ